MYTYNNYISPLLNVNGVGFVVGIWCVLITLKTKLKISDNLPIDT